MKTRTMFWLMMLIFSAQVVHAQTPLSSTLSDQKEVAITIYNNNLGLVKDLREVTLNKGTQELLFKDVAAKINPTTVHIKSLSEPNKLEVLEQNYEYDLLSPQKLLEKFVGKEVEYKIILKDQERIVPATLLSLNNGIVLRAEGKIYNSVPYAQVIVPKIPENLIAQPTLVWLLQNEGARKHRVEASYLTDGINWKADYVVVLDAKDKNIDVTGWVTIDNKSGATYKNAKLKLVAGDVQRVEEERRKFERPAMAMGKAAAPQFEEKAFFEYHLYTLGRPTTIKDNQTKQMTLLSAANVPVDKKYNYYGASYYYRDKYGEPQSPQKIAVYLELKNSKENHMGMPLPKGIVRVYKADDDKSLQFIGEDRIDHTPKDEKIKIKLGEAFDLVGERKQTEFTVVAKNLYEVAFEVSLRNHKEEKVVINVIEPIPGDWQVLNTNYEYKKVDAHTVRFEVPVEKNKESKLRYKVRIRW